MKRINLLMVGLILSLNAISQSSEWKKEDRNKLYEEGMNITSKYKSLTEEQKSTISLCYLNEITKKYTKSELDSKIDIEIKRIQEATVTTCAKNIGVDLNEVQKSSGSNDLKLSKEAILGQWYSDVAGSITFNEDNTYKHSLKNCTSTYIVSSDAITLSKEIGYGLACPQRYWKIVKITSKEMMVIQGGTSFSFNRVK